MKITEKQFANASVASIVCLLCFWVIPDTIALRHLLLATGCLSSIGLICYNWGSLRPLDINYLPLIAIFSLYFWVLIHFTFFSLNPELELSEIMGLWVRTLMGTIAALGLGIAIVKYSKLRLYFYIALFLTPAINVLAYCWASYLNHGLLKPTNFYRFLYTKIETAYFGAIATAVATGNLIHLLVGKTTKFKIHEIFWWFFGLALVLVSALIANTKNGIAIALSLCVFLTVIVLINSIFYKGRVKMVSIFMIIAILFLSAGVWQEHKSLANRGWDTILQDAALGLDIDNNKQWQKGEATVPMPINSLGIPAAINTYTRFAYATVGVRLISKYPLGYGSINGSFKGLQELAEIPHEHGGQVHSGWIDFGLALGIPGLFLIFISLLAIIYFGLKSKSSIALPWAIFCLAIIPFGLIAEITYKQYFEATIFFLSLASIIIILESRDSYRRY